MATGLLAGRIALVTGGASGIGKAVCQTFAREGAKVAVVDINKGGAKETLQTLQGEHHAFAADISSSTSVTGLVQDIASRFGAPACITVNAAGITKDSFFLKMDEASYDQVLNVNLKGTFLVSQAAGRLMVKERVKTGSIINISSISGKVGNVGQANYTATKAGVIALTKTISKELSRYGIRCNAILPGFIETPMALAVPEKVLEKLIQMIPMTRMGKPEEIADTCVFLASDKSSYITGTTIEVTGGLFM